MKKIKLDLAFETSLELLKALENLTNDGINYRVIHAEGPGAKWPEFELEGKEVMLRIAVDRLTDDLEYYDEFVENHDIITIGYEKWLSDEEDDRGRDSLSLFEELTSKGISYEVQEGNGPGGPPYYLRLTGEYEILKEWILETKYIETPEEFEEIIIK